MKSSLYFVVTTPFAVNAFLRSHLLKLSTHFDVVLCVNQNAYALNEDIKNYVRVVHIGIERKISPFRDLKALFDLLRLFVIESPDAVHSITPKAGLLGMMASFLACVPIRSHTFTGQVWANKKGFGRWALKTIDRLIVGMANRVFADSASQCRFLESESVLGKGKIAVLGDGSIAGVDLFRFKPNRKSRIQIRTQLGTANDAAVCLFVGRLVRDKGVFDLISAFVDAVSQRPGMELWMVGPDEDSLLTSLKKKAGDVCHKIRWIGPTSVPEEYMAASDVFVLPSYREGFGSVIIEAAACGLPTIAYRIDGVIDAIVEGDTGILIDKGNVGQLSSAMCHLADKQAERGELGAKALARAMSKFSSVTVTNAWVRFYINELVPYETNSR